MRLEQFHRHADQLVAHYAPEIRRALAERVSRQRVMDVARQAYQRHGRLEKVTPSGRPTPARIASAAAASAGGAGAAGIASGGAGVAVLASAIAGELANVVTVSSAAGLVAVLSSLYADAYLHGAHEAAAAAGGSLPPWTVAIPAGYWTHFEPQSGVALAAQTVAGGGLAQLLAGADVTIRGVTHTQLERIGDAVATGIQDGFPIAEVERKVDAIIDTAARANMIAETEYARAVGVAQMDVYRRWRSRARVTPRRGRVRAVHGQRRGVTAADG